MLVATLTTLGMTLNMTLARFLRDLPREAIFARS